jgi:hydroxymethylpyrimidine/phosphomethylpyrimidine kinase
MTATPAIAMTIAGSDPSGGAGIQADLKTFTALGVYGASVITALTAQNTMGVTGVMTVPVNFIEAQFEAVARDLNIAAIKTGMLANAETVLAVARLLRHAAPPALVVDPVMVATSGDPLVADDAVSALRTELMPLADIVTPNLPEAGRLLGQLEAQTLSEMRDQAAALLKLGCRAVLLKGGHGQGGEAVDVLAWRGGMTELSKPRIETRNTHGTGCTLAAAITAGLAKGRPLNIAVEEAKDFVWQALRSGAAHKIGGGAGPIDHLYRLRSPKPRS